MGKDPGPGGGGGGGEGGFTLPGHRSGDPAAIGISRRAPTEICPWLNPPPPCSAGKGQLLPQTPGRSRWPCWLPAGVRGTGQGWWPGPIKPSSPTALPGSAYSMWVPEASGFPRPHARLSGRRGLRQAPGSGRAAGPEGQQPPATVPGTARSQPRGSRDFSLSHGEARGTRRPGELSAVSFLAGSVGKTGESEGSAPG